MKEKLSTFKKFNSVHEKAKMEKENAKKKAKLITLTEEYHEAQIKLQGLQKEFIETETENKIEREKLKTKIIEQSRIVKEKENSFNSAFGKQDIIDLEI
jgi:hypothetical protein